MGYHGGHEPWFVIVEVRWPDKPLSAPEYVCRGSNQAPLTDEILKDQRFEGCTVVAATDEIDAQGIAECGAEVVWCRVSTGPGAVADEQARSCLIVPTAELHTILQRLALSKRLTFPERMRVLASRVGGEIQTEDRELIALGVACWYAYGRDDAVREQPQRRWLPRAEATQEAGPWEQESCDPEEDSLAQAVARLARGR